MVKCNFEIVECVRAIPNSPAVVTGSQALRAGSLPLSPLWLTLRPQLSRQAFRCGECAVLRSEWAS
jgi:hypothetical protein